MQSGYTNLDHQALKCLDLVATQQLYKQKL